jgi:nicotinate-nucleotide adenylyltransferase
MERVGVFGGTFDPIHVGHLVAAANVPWQKGDRVLTPAEDRLAVVEAAVEGAEGLEASRLEIDRGGESYTADTLEELMAADPRRELFLVVGADVAAELETWRRVDVVARLATLVVVTRGAVPQPRLGPPWRMERVEIPALEVSSSDLRARRADGRPLDFLIPRPAIDCMRRRGLYA